MKIKHIGNAGFSFFSKMCLWEDNMTPFHSIPTISISNLIENNTVIVERPTVTHTTHSNTFNYASFDCGALIRAANQESSHSTSILLNSKDAYMLNPCSASKFIEIEVCQDILVSRVSLANFEYFSSMFREFRVFGSSKVPAEWIALGNFTASNSRERQSFEIQDPVIWSKFVRIDFDSHYGSEFYCPLTSVQVFGTTMMEEVKGLQISAVPITEASTTIDEASPATSTLKIPFLATPVDTCIPEEDVLVTPTSYVSKQESIFTKIMQRLTKVENLVSTIDQNLLLLQDFVNMTYVRQFQDLLDSVMQAKVVEMDRVIQSRLEELDQSKHEIERSLSEVTGVLEDLKVQLSWSQFWNHFMIVVSLIFFKLVNDRLGLWNVLFHSKETNLPFKVAPLQYPNNVRNSFTGNKKRRKR